MRYFWILTLCLFAPLDAKLEDHFKKIEDKSDVHSMRNIDFIYLINLDVRVEKLVKTFRQLAPYEIYPYRFSAVNGWELTIEDLQDIGLKYTKDMKKMKGTTYLTEDRKPTYETLQEGKKGYFRHKMSWGMVGCLLSHLSILQDAYDSGYSTIWVMEDDIVVIRDPRQIPDLIDRLDKKVGKHGWDILFTDRDFRNSEGKYERCKGWSPRPNFKPSNPERFKDSYLIDKTFRRIGARFGTHSMILRRSGIKKILEFIKTYQPFNPYDLDMYLPDDMRMYSVNRDIVGNEPSELSDTKAIHSN
jgi:GR25 family glycosyltransferase involved in LPS biosynthesis